MQSFVAKETVQSSRYYRIFGLLSWSAGDYLEGNSIFCCGVATLVGFSNSFRVKKSTTQIGRSCAGLLCNAKLDIEWA